MMKIRLFLVVFMAQLWGQCATELIAKPDNLIPEKQMIGIQVDLGLMEVIQKQYRGEIRNDSLLGLPYIYQKYKIDCLQLLNSEAYYAQNPKKYARIYLQIKHVLDKKVDSLNRVIQQTKKKSN